jgi:hypothetical protein
MATTEWIMDDFRSDEAAHVIQGAFIAVVCNKDPVLKERLKFLLTTWANRATDPAARKILSDAVAWVEQLRIGGTP